MSRAELQGPGRGLSSVPWTGVRGESPVHSTILGLKAEIKTLRQKARDLTAANQRWQTVAQTMRKLAGLDEEKFANLLRQEGLE